MSRNMIAANEAVFAVLDQYAIRAGQRLANHGKPRWIATDASDKEILKNFELTQGFRISPSRAMARFDRHPDVIFLTFGFSEGFYSPNFPAIEVGAGLLTAGLCELRPQPVASLLEIINIVEASDQETPGYAGHEASDVASLFPRAAAVLGINLAPSESWRAIFHLCLCEASCSDSWIEGQLAKDLDLLFTLDLLEVPYRILSRALFDVDPASLFLALYRALEFLYVYTSASKLKDKLGLTQDWSTIGAALEEDLGWYPREADSLHSLLRLGSEADLKRAYQAIVGKPIEENCDIPVVAGRAIYNLRNSIVHYRPTHRQLDREAIDWSSLCSSMVYVMSYIYSDIFGSL